MSYKSRYGITKIRATQINALDISYDHDTDDHDLAQRRPVLLFTPNMDDTAHHHIELTRAEAAQLHRWLTDYLEATRGVRMKRPCWRL